MDDSRAAMKSLMESINRLIRGRERSYMELATGQPFRRITDIVRGFSRTYLTMFLSSRKYAPHQANIHGLHAFRSLLAERLLHERRELLDIDLNHPDIRSFQRDGILVKHIPSLSDKSISLQDRAELVRIFQYAAGDSSIIDENFRLVTERVTHRAIDMQHYMHMDSFSSTIKVFGFLKPVRSKNGPVRDYQIYSLNSQH